jgi:hypothetical protein
MNESNAQRDTEKSKKVGKKRLRLEEQGVGF